MGFHPTLGRPKTNPGVRLKRSSQGHKRTGTASYTRQIKDLTDEDIRMIRQVVQLLNTQYFNKTNKIKRRKRFG